MYSPTLGRFITTDPIGFQAGDTNLFRFVSNRPTNATDPTGLAELPTAPPPRPVNRPPIVAPRPRPAGMPPLKYTEGPVLAGHGEWFPEHGYTVVPEGTTITFFVPAGDFLGNVDEKDPLLSEPPEFWATRERPKDRLFDRGWFDHRPSARLVDQRSPSALAPLRQKDGPTYWYETYYPGESVPDYTLFPAEGGPTGVRIGDKLIPLETPKVGVASDKATTVKKPTRLSQFLKPNQGDVWWSACRQHAKPQKEDE